MRRPRGGFLSSPESATPPTLFSLTIFPVSGGLLLHHEQQRGPMEANLSGHEPSKEGTNILISPNLSLLPGLGLLFLRGPPSVVPFPFMVHQKLAAIVAGVSLVGASLPSISAEERAGSVLKPENVLPQDQNAVAVEQAIERYRDRIREIYLANGKDETLLTEQVRKLDAAVKELIRDLNPQFDAKAFDRVSLVDKINTLSNELFTHGYIVGHFDMTADARDGSKALLSINLDRVISSTTVQSGDLDFSDIGLTSNPLPRTLPFFETTTVIVEAPGSAPLSPLSALTIDLKKKTYGLVLGHDAVARCLPGYDPSEQRLLDPNVRAFLTDWALGRLAYHVGGEREVCSLPQSIEVNGRSLPLRSVMGLAYALERCGDTSPTLAAVVCNYIGISASTPDNLLLGTTSQLIRQRLAKSFPGIESIRDARGAKDFFEQRPDAAKAYLETLRALVREQVKAIKDDFLGGKNAPRQGFSI
jgi:hypothetical protein